MINNTLLSALVLLCYFSQPLSAVADQLGDGVSAFERGDYKSALNYLAPLAESGNAGAQTEIGVMYHEGSGVAKDLKKAAYWYRLAADQEQPVAQFNLGNSYASGEGVPKDEVEALMWWKRAASHDHRTSMYNIGNSYMFGQGVQRDAAEAIKWWRKAANRGYATAQFNLLVSYSHGPVAERDLVEAFKWCTILSLRKSVGDEVTLLNDAKQECAKIKLNESDKARALFFGMHWIEKHPMQ